MSPCGACRQVLKEFSSDGSLEVVMAHSDGQQYKVSEMFSIICGLFICFQVMTISELLPCSFSSEDLDKTKT